MEPNIKAKILLNNGSFKNYIDFIFKKYDIITDEIENDFYNQIEKRKEEYDEWKIKINWNGNSSDFIADGYRRNDIEYENYQELEEGLKPEIILEMAQTFVKKYFDNDNDFLDEVENYIKSCL